MDWSQNLPRPPCKQFKPRWFLQPTESTHVCADWVGEKIPASYWDSSGPVTEVGTKDQEDQLVDWAEEQGPGGMLFLEQGKAKGDTVVGYVLLMD